MSEFHDKRDEIWLVFYKVKTKKVSIKYDEAVEEALCFGWIDSTVRRVDDEKHMQRYTPRKASSNWSLKNKQRVSELIEKGLMTDIGLRSIEIAKNNGSWKNLDSVDIRLEVPQILEDAFKRNEQARLKYEELSPSRKKQFLWWIDSAKRNTTKEKRTSETIKMLLENKLLQ